MILIQDSRVSLSLELNTMQFSLNLYEDEQIIWYFACLGMLANSHASWANASQRGGYWSQRKWAYGLPVRLVWNSPLRGKRRTCHCKSFVTDRQTEVLVGYFESNSLSLLIFVLIQNIYGTLRVRKAAYLRSIDFFQMPHFFKY